MQAKEGGTSLAGRDMKDSCKERTLGQQGPNHSDPRWDPPEQGSSSSVRATAGAPVAWALRTGGILYANSVYFFRNPVQGLRPPRWSSFPFCCTAAKPTPPPAQPRTPRLPTPRQAIPSPVFQAHRHPQHSLPFHTTRAEGPAQDPNSVPPESAVAPRQGADQGSCKAGKKRHCTG